MTKAVTYHAPGEFGEGANVVVTPGAALGETQVLEITPLEFPIKHDDIIQSIPWETIKPHEVQMLRNHGRGLAAMASRGGLTPCEALAVIEGRPWERMAFTDARRRLTDYVMGAVANEETRAALEAASSPQALNLEDLRAAMRMVEDFRRGTQHPTRWNLNRLMVTLERVKGRVEEHRA